MGISNFKRIIILTIINTKYLFISCFFCTFALINVVMMRISEKIPKDRIKAYKEFKRFLKNKGVYMPYIRNIRRDDSFRDLYNRNLVDFFTICPIDNWLTECFIWVEQPEGNDFWLNLHESWRDYYFYYIK